MKSFVHFSKKVQPSQGAVVDKFMSALGISYSEPQSKTTSSVGGAY